MKGKDFLNGFLGGAFLVFVTMSIIMGVMMGPDGLSHG